MFVGFLTWWYGDGLTARLNGLSERLARVSDFFSVGLLIKTLFSPFRQLSVGRVKGSLEVQLRAFFDNLVSRLIGGFVRSTMVCVAGFAWIAAALYGIGIILGWLVLPVLPALGFLLTVAAVVMGVAR